MVFFIVRGFSLATIAAMTCVLWVQDHSKKVVVVKNAAQTYFSKDKPQQVVTTSQGTVVAAQKKGVIQIYKQTSSAKSQKLAEKHLIFGALSFGGALLMPKMYFLLSVAYFIAYQIYYFALNELQFTPIWQAFMVAGAGIIGAKFLKLIT